VQGKLLLAFNILFLCNHIVILIFILKNRMLNEIKKIVDILFSILFISVLFQIFQMHPSSESKKIPSYDVPL